MPSYAGAKAAIEQRLRANWTATSIAVHNPTSEQASAVTKTDADGENIPWAFLEIQDAGSSQRGSGAPGSNVFVYDGLIAVHVFVPVGSGTALAAEHADAIGEIYRNREFYRDEPGYCVRSWAPRIDSGDSASDDGLWFRVSVTIPFEYWHRA